jgi:FemAB-related protein (PEP-CTERM system-associated)
MQTDLAIDRGAAADGATTVELAAASDRAAWDAFVASQRTATGYHEWAWREVIERTFGHDCPYLLSRRERDGEVTGVLPLVEMRSLLFGRLLTSLPFLNYGGALAASDETARALVDKAVGRARERGCRHLELRHTARRLDGWPHKQHKVAMRLDLRPGLWEALDRKVRNQIRKAEKSNLVVERGGADRLPEFYAVFARNMRDLGTPVYPRRLFEEVLRAFPDRARIVLVRLEGRPIAAALTYRTGGVVEVPWASSIREFNQLCPNHLLYWHALETALAEGAETFDFGRSTPGEGTYKFKEQWGARPSPLYWEYWLRDGEAPPDQGPQNPRYRLAVETWKRMPLWLANTAGPRIVRGIP